ncbi:MAG: hypothetical protein ACUVRD_00300 [Bacteroidia bacterium]
MRYLLFLSVGLFAAPQAHELLKPTVEVFQTHGPKKRKSKKLKKANRNKKTYDLPCGC